MNKDTAMMHMLAATAAGQDRVRAAMIRNRRMTARTFTGDPVWVAEQRMAKAARKRARKAKRREANKARQEAGRR